MSVRGERTGRVLLAVGAPSATAKPRFQALGVLLSTIGTSLVILTVIMTVGGGVLLTILGARVSSGNETADALAIAAVFAGLMSVGTTTLTLLFATCFLMLGEQLRRGGIGSSPRPRRGVLPRGSYLSAFRPIGTGWHALWAVSSVALALVLLLVPIVGDVTRGWPSSLPSDYSFSDEWQLNGIVALALAVAVSVSLFKKRHYFRMLARFGPFDRAGQPGTSTWRWLTYRWRIDLWLAAFGGLLTGLSTIAISSTSWQEADPATVSNLLGGLVLLVPGIAVVALGAWLASNYWKAGEPIGSAESFV